MKRTREMCALDFKEIPKGNENSGKQDAFELFAEEFLTTKGFEIIEGPGRGPDGGKDLIVEYVSGQYPINAGRYVVSCKHYAHSGKSVTPNDESNIRDKVDSKKCDGFIAFYSTLPSQNLRDILDGLKERIHIEVLHWARIEKGLLDDDRCRSLVKRFFPKSYQKWIETVDLPLEMVRSELARFCFPPNSPYSIDLQIHSSGYLITPRLRAGFEDAEPLKLTVDLKNEEPRALLKGEEIRVFKGKINESKTSTELKPFLHEEGEIYLVPLERYAEAVIIAENDDGDAIEIRDQLVHIDSDPNSGNFSIKVVTPMSPIELELRRDSEGFVKWTIDLDARGKSTLAMSKGVEFMECLAKTGTVTLRIAQENNVRLEGRRHISQYVPGKEELLATDVAAEGIDIVQLKHQKSYLKDLRLIERRLELCLILKDFPGKDVDLAIAHSLATVLRNGKHVYEDDLRGQSKFQLKEIDELLKSSDETVCFPLDSFVLPRIIHFMGLQMRFDDIGLIAEMVQLIDGEKERLKELIDTSPDLPYYEVNWQSVPGNPVTEVLSTPIVELIPID